jgi:hypothetical protein
MLIFKQLIKKIPLKKAKFNKEQQIKRPKITCVIFKISVDLVLQ